MDTTHNRLARLRAEIAAGTYAPPADAVAEALVGWIARARAIRAVRARW